MKDFLERLHDRLAMLLFLRGLPPRLEPQPALAELGCAQIARHDDDGVAEVNRTAMAVRQPSVVQYLEQHVEHVRVRLLDFVEEHHPERTPPDRLRKLAGLVVADVARRRADEPRDRVPLAELGHVDPHHVLLVVEQVLGQRPRQLRSYPRL